MVQNGNSFSHWHTHPLQLLPTLTVNTIGLIWLRGFFSVPARVSLILWSMNYAIEQILNRVGSIHPVSFFRKSY